MYVLNFTYVTQDVIAQSSEIEAPVKDSFRHPHAVIRARSKLEYPEKPSTFSRELLALLTRVRQRSLLGY